MKAGSLVKHRGVPQLGIGVTTTELTEQYSWKGYLKVEVNWLGYSPLRGASRTELVKNLELISET